MKKIDTQEHFTVPEGYFENFTEHMMNILPEQEFQPMKVDNFDSVKEVENKRILPVWSRYVTAACVVGVLVVSAVTTFYHGTDSTEKEMSPVASVTTTIADSSKKVMEVVAPVKAVVTDQPVLAKAETHAVNVKPSPAEHIANVPTHKEKTSVKSHTATQNYDVEINTDFNQNDVDRAAMYLGIDHQDMCEMMYEGL